MVLCGYLSLSPKMLEITHVLPRIRMGRLSKLSDFELEVICLFEACMRFGKRAINERILHQIISKSSFTTTFELILLSVSAISNRS